MLHVFPNADRAAAFQSVTKSFQIFVCNKLGFLIYGDHDRIVSDGGMTLIVLHVNSHSSILANLTPYICESSLWKSNLKLLKMQ